jgi:dTDP-4-amino-4,6-dideoxygalactose transaminase
MAAATEAVVPFFDLTATNRDICNAFLNDVAHLVEANQYILGPPVSAFEDAFAGYCAAAACVGVASGLDALRLGLIAAGIEPGDEVIVPAMTFVATFEAVIQAGALPVPVDVRDDDFGLDAASIEAAVTERTRAVLPVHLYGQMVDILAVGAVCERHRLVVVEDACQAHGAVRDGIRPGNRGIAAAFSFYPSKNLGAFGDAGAVVTDDLEVARRVMLLRDHGSARKYEHVLQGYTARLDAIQAAVLLRKLKLLDAWNDERRQCATLYSEALTGVGDLRLPTVAQGSTHVWHQYVVRTSAPEALAEFLRNRGVGTGRHYPRPPHLLPAYADLGHGPDAFPIAESLSRECLSLPLYPGLSEQQSSVVTAAIREYFDG